MTVYDGVLQGLNEALEHTHGKREMRTTRVSARTVEAWEAGRNEPSGAARYLLYLLDNDHSLIQRLVAQ